MEATERVRDAQLIAHLYAAEWKKTAEIGLDMLIIHQNIMEAAFVVTRQESTVSIGVAQT